jgi:hypothetical protein
MTNLEAPPAGFRVGILIVAYRRYDVGEHDKQGQGSAQVCY